MRRASLLGIGTAVVLALTATVACGMDVVPDRLRADEASRVAPAGARTGIVEIDTLTAAVLDRAPEVLATRARHQYVPCVLREPATRTIGPLCAGNEPRGTAVEAFYERGCQARWSRDALATVTAFVQEAERLHSVVRAPRAPEGWPAGEYAIVFEDDRGTGMALFVDADGGVALTWPGCRTTADELLERWRHGGLLLRPRLPVAARRLRTRCGTPLRLQR